MTSCIDGLNLHPKSVHESVVVLDTLTARLLGAGDARAAFPDIYGIVTRAVAAEVGKPDGMFLEPSWISRLAGRFCDRYLETLRFFEEGAPQDCGAWRVAYAQTSSRLTIPVQHALLGFSAHINYDLVLGIYTTIRESGHERDPKMLARFKHDHDQVNTLLRRSIPEALEHLAVRHGCSLSALCRDTAPETARWLAMQLLTNWREHVWTNVVTLLATPSTEQRSAVMQSVDRRALRIGQALAIPGLRPVGSAPPQAAQSAAWL
jgi:hypothetical protein